MRGRGSKGKMSKAVEAAARGRYIMISVNPPVYTYLGVASDYVLVDESYCSCESFATILRRGKRECKHILGLYVAREKGKILVNKLPPRDVSRIVIETMLTGRASTLRSLIKM